MLLSIPSWLLGSLLLLAVIIAACLMLATWWIAAKAERLVPALGKFIEIDGNRIHYVEEGEGSGTAVRFAGTFGPCAEPVGVGNWTRKGD